MTRNKERRLVLDCDSDFHDLVKQYARRNNRSVMRLMKHALLVYMRQNPVYKDGEYESTES